MKLSSRTGKVLEFANMEAFTLGHATVTSLHVLVAIIKEGTGVVARFFFDEGVHLDLVRSVVRKFAPLNETVPRNIVLSHQMMGVIKIAETTAVKMGDKEICPIHIFLAMMISPAPEFPELLSALGVARDGLAEKLVATYQEKKYAKVALALLNGFSKDAEVQEQGITPGWFHVKMDTIDPVVLRMLRSWLGVSENQGLDAIAYKVVSH